jgi:DNA gyrase subunit B
MKKSEPENFRLVDAIRKRPAMYIGSSRLFGLIQYLVYPVSILLSAGAKQIAATLVDGMFQISSDAQIDITEADGLINPFQQIQDSPWYAYGAAVLNALSEELYLSIRTPESREELHFTRGNLISRDSTTGKQTKPGTVFKFKPDPEIFEVLQTPPVIFESYFRRLSYLHSGVRFSLVLGDDAQEFYQPNGIRALFTAVSSPYQLMHEPIHIVGQKDSLTVEIVMAYHSWSNDHWLFFMNNGRVVEGGTHETGLFSGLRRLKKHLGLPEGFRNGMLGIASMHYPGTVWEGCIKAKVHSPELRTMVSQIVLDEGLKWLNSHPDVAKEIPNISRFEFPDIWYK